MTRKSAFPPPPPEPPRRDGHYSGPYPRAARTRPTPTPAQRIIGIGLAIGTVTLAFLVIIAAGVALIRWTVGA